MNIRHKFLGLLLIVAMAMSVARPARAVIVTGAFAGTAFNVTGHDHLPDGGNGSLLSGTFSFDSDAEQSGPDGMLASSMNFTMTLDLLGRHLVYGPGGVSIFTVENGAAGQVVSLNDQTPYWSGGILLAGAAGAFVDGFDLGSFRAAPVDAARSSIWFTPGRWSGWSADTVLTSVTIDPLPVTTPIPEPSTWAALLLGLAVLGWRFWPVRPEQVQPSRLTCALTTRQPSGVFIHV